MKNKNIISISFPLIVSFLMTIPLFASQSMSLEEAFSIAVSSNESVQIQLEKIKVAEAQYRQMKSVTLPQIFFRGSESIQDNSAAGNGPDSPFTASHRPEYKFSVQQSIFGGLREWDALNAQEAIIDKEKINLTQVKRDLYLSVSDVYFASLLAQKQLDYVKEYRKLYQSRMDELGRRIRVGKSRFSESLAVDAQLLELRAQENGLDYARSKAVLDLQQILKKEPADLELSEPNINAIKVPDSGTIYQSLERRPELLALEADKKFYYYQKRAAKHERLPSLSVGANYYLERVEVLNPIKWDAVLSLDIPIYQGGVENAMSKVADAQLRQIDAIIANQRRVLKTEILSDYLALKAHLEVRSDLQAAHNKTQETLKISEEEYRLGLINNLEVLQVMSNLLEIKNRLNAATVDVYVAANKLMLDMREQP
jgi:outer membrane protein TolC